MDLNCLLYSSALLAKEVAQLLSHCITNEKPPKNEKNRKWKCIIVSKISTLRADIIIIQQMTSEKPTKKIQNSSKQMRKGIRSKVKQNEKKYLKS